MDIEGFLTSIELFDLVAVLFLFGMFVLGFAQGTIRRLLGLASILFSFLLAGQLRGPLGSFLADNWDQWSSQYNYMLAYLGVFVFASILFSIIVQSFYKSQPLFEKARFIDEVIGGLIGILQGAVIIAAGIVILDSFFVLPGIPEDPDEIGLLRSIFDLYDPSVTAALFRDVLIPGAFAIFGALVPADVQALFTSGVEA